MFPRRPAASSALQYGASTGNPAIAVQRTLEFRNGTGTTVTVSIANNVARTLSVVANGRAVADSASLPGGTTVKVLRFDPPANGVKRRVILDAGG